MSDLRSGRERLIKGFSYRDESGFIIQTPEEFFFLPDEPLLMSEQKRNYPHAEICGVNPLEIHGVVECGDHHLLGCDYHVKGA